MAFDNPLAQEIWSSKYRFAPASGAAADDSIEATWRRVAIALADGEAHGAAHEAEIEGRDDDADAAHLTVGDPQRIVGAGGITGFF